MGMDHPHLRWAVLWQAPPSLLALAQSIGRAGRHRLMKSQALILWDDEDFQLIQWVTHGSKRRLQELQEVRDFLTQNTCRRAALARYFSSCSALAYCNQCDFCDGQ
jgi:superfamily II DNA helicase RecQ